MSTEKKSGIRVVVIGGSVRTGNFTMKAVALVVNELRNAHKVTVDVVDPAALKLAPPGTEGTPDGEQVRGLVTNATGVILATPEYHGCFSSVIKLMIENLGFPSVLAGKPVALLGVAAGAIGAIKSLEALSSVCAHVGAIVLPGSVSVANVQGVFDEQGRCLDAKVEKRIRSVAKNLVDYIHGAICPRIALEAMVRGGAATTK